MDEVIRVLRLLRVKTRQIAAIARLSPFDTSTPAGRSQERYRRILLNSSSTLITRGLTLVVSLVTVPLVLQTNGVAQFGLWSIITSSVTWVSLFQLGLANGLVNVISEAHGKSDQSAAATYVSTAFFYLLAIAIVLSLAFIGGAGHLNWASILGVRGQIDPSIVKWSLIAAGLPVLAGMPLTVVPQIYAGYQRAYISNAFSALGWMVTLAVFMWAVGRHAGLPVLILVYGGIGVVASAVNLGYLVTLDVPWLAPRLALVTRRAFRRLWQTSLPLFLFQLGALVVNSTQILVLAYRSSLHTVADYAVVFRLYVVLMGSIALSSYAFLPTLREAFERGDMAWTQSGFRRLVGLRMTLAILASVGIVAGGNRILQLWLGRSDMNLATAEWLALAALILSATWTTVFNDFLIIMDRIWIQVGLVFANGISTLLLTVWLAPMFGVLGALIALTAFTALIQSWLVPILARPILSHR